MWDRRRGIRVVGLGLCCAVALLSCADPAPSGPAAPEPGTVQPPGPTSTARPTPPRGRPGGDPPDVRFELPTVGADYAQKDQWLERLVNNCEEVLHRRERCLDLRFSFFHRVGRTDEPFTDPGTDYDSDELGDCTVRRMSIEGSRNRMVPVGSTIQIRVVCVRDEEIPPETDQTSQPPDSTATSTEAGP